LAALQNSAAKPGGHMKDKKLLPAIQMSESIDLLWLIAQHKINDFNYISIYFGTVDYKCFTISFGQREREFDTFEQLQNFIINYGEEK